MHSDIVHSDTQSLGHIGGKTKAAAAQNFLTAKPQRPHPSRRRAILQAHPDVESLIGYDRLTLAITLAVVLGQCTRAAFFGPLGLSYCWAALIAAYCIGAFQSRDVRRHS